MPGIVVQQRDEEREKPRREESAREREPSCGVSGTSGSECSGGGRVVAESSRRSGRSRRPHGSWGSPRVAGRGADLASDRSVS